MCAPETREDAAAAAAAAETEFTSAREAGCGCGCCLDAGKKKVEDDTLPSMSTPAPTPDAKEDEGLEERMFTPPDRRMASVNERRKSAPPMPPPPPPPDLSDRRLVSPPPPPPAASVLKKALVLRRRRVMEPNRATAGVVGPHTLPNVLDRARVTVRGASTGAAMESGGVWLRRLEVREAFNPRDALFPRLWRSAAAVEFLVLRAVARWWREDGARPYADALAEGPSLAGVTEPDRRGCALAMSRDDALEDRPDGDDTPVPMLS